MWSGGIPTYGRTEREADTKHVPMVLRDVGLEKSSYVKSTPLVTLVLLASAKPLNAKDTTLHRSITTSPTTKEFEELTRVRPYLRGRPVEAIVFILGQAWEHIAKHHCVAVANLRNCGQIALIFSSCSRN